MSKYTLPWGHREWCVIGMLLRQKMGWNHGQGLGKNNEGSEEPLHLDVNVDRKGQ